MEWHIGDKATQSVNYKEHSVYCENPIITAITSIKYPFDMKHVINALSGDIPPAPILHKQTNIEKFNNYDAMDKVIHEEISSDEEGHIIKKRITSPYKYAYNTKKSQYLPDDFIVHPDLYSPISVNLEMGDPEPLSLDGNY